MASTPELPTQDAIHFSSRAAILREAVRLASEAGVDSIKIVEVLAGANASSSSLYHHFQSRAGLLRAVRAEREWHSLLEEDPSLLEALDGLSTPAEFAEYMGLQLRRIISEPAAIRRREQRLEALAQSEANRGADQAIEQLIDRTTEFVQTAIDRSLCRPDLDARGYAVFFMGLSLGQIATRDLLAPERWLATATEAALAPLRF